MTTEQKKRLLEFIKDVMERRDGFCSDDDIMDFCDENDIPSGEAFKFIDEYKVPSCCKGCKHVGMYDNMYPCDLCSRPRQDMYEKA